MGKTLDNDSDQELLRRMLAGERAAFEKLYERWQSGIYRFSLRMSGSEALAEDITQDVFLILIRGGWQYSGRGKFSSYIFTIARHCTLRRLSREKRYVEIGGEAPDDGAPVPCNLISGDDPLLNLSRGELAEAVRQAVMALPLHYREVVLLCHLHELSYSDAAEVIGCEIGTVCSRLYRARALLAERLEALKEGGEAEGLEGKRILRGG